MTFGDMILSIRGCQKKRWPGEQAIRPSSSLAFVHQSLTMSAFLHPSWARGVGHWGESNASYGKSGSRPCVPLFCSTRITFDCFCPARICLSVHTEQLLKREGGRRVIRPSVWGDLRTAFSALGGIPQPARQLDLGRVEGSSVPDGSSMGEHRNLKQLRCEWAEFASCEHELLAYAQRTTANNSSHAPSFSPAQLLSALCSLLRCRFQLLSLDTSIELDMGWILLPTEQLQLISWMAGNLAQPPTCDSGSRRVSVSRVSVNCRVKWHPSLNI